MSTPETAFQRMCEDVREVAEYTCRHLKQKKVILAGQSWGTMLGMQAVSKWPHLFHAFVGTGFMVSWSDSLRSLTDSTRQQATVLKDQAALDALAETATLPETDMRRLIAANKYRWAPADLEYLKIQREFVGAPPLPEHGDVADWVHGSGFTVPKLLPLLLAYDVRKITLDVSVPFIVVQGREDHVTPIDAAEKYMREVHAPVKKLVPISGGHFACFTNPAEFVGALRQHVRPLVR